MTNRSYFELLSKHMNAPPHGANGHPRSQEAPSNGGNTRLVGGRYELGPRIGRGRHGEIYEAVDTASVTMGVSRQVAIQLIDDSVVSSPQMGDELTRICGALRAGSHPNVVRILNFGRDRHALFIAMDLLEGVSVRTVLDDAAPEPLSFEEAGPVILGVGDALDYLHAKGLVYGDLRADNVFVTFDYRVKLLDVARVTASPQAADESGVVPAAPKHDARDDVYALACLSYELLAGRHPFNANSLVEARRAGLAPRPLPGLTPARWAAIAHGLAFLRSERTRSIREYLDALGLTGQERLRAGADADAQSAAPPAAEYAPAPPPIRAAAPPAWPTAPPDEDVVVPRRARARRAVSDAAAWLQAQQHYEVPNPGKGALRATVAFAALALIAAFAFIYRDALRGATMELMAAFAPPQPSTLQPARPAVEPGAADAAPPAVQDAPAAAASAQPQAGGVQPPAAPQAGDPQQQARVTPPQQGGAAPGATAPAQAEGASSAPARSPAEQPPLAPSEDAAPGVADGASAQSRMPEFERSSVTVREGDSAAALVIRRIGDTSSPVTVTWWPSDQNAVADQDYADLGHRVERLAAGEERRTILVPLIGDSAPERTESFYVYLGRANASRSELSVTSSVRVDIVDDD
jgi:Protein kinase domain/Calx-beta domain